MGSRIRFIPSAPVETFIPKRFELELQMLLNLECLVSCTTRDFVNSTCNSVATYMTWSRKDRGTKGNEGKREIKGSWVNIDKCVSHGTPTLIYLVTYQESLLHVRILCGMSISEILANLKCT